MLRLLRKGPFLFLAILPLGLIAFALAKDPGSRLVFTILFLAMGIITRVSLLFGYLSFIFLLPLLPSIPEQWKFPALNLFEFLFLSLSFWWAISHLIKKNTRFVKTGINLDIGLFFLFCILSLLLNLQGLLSFPEIFALKLKDFPLLSSSPPQGDLSGLYSLKSFAEGFLLFFLTVDILRNHKIEQAVRILFFSAVFVSLLGIFQYVARFNLLEHWSKDNSFLVRINSTLSDPNELGSFLAASFFLGIGSAISSAGKKRRVLFLAAFIVLVAAILTVSRTAIVSILLGAFVVPAFLVSLNSNFSRLFRKTSRWVKKIAYLFLLIILILIVSMAAMDYRAEKPRNVFQLAATTLNPRQPLQTTLNGRLYLWNGAFHIFLRNPLIGCGLGRFPAVFTKSFGEPFPGALNAHNYFLQLLAELGSVGLVLFLFIIVRTIRSSAQVSERSDQELSHLYGILCAVIVFLVTSITGHPLLLLKMQLFFWSLIGMIWATSRKSASIAAPKRSLLSPIIFSLGVIIIAFSSITSKLDLPYEHGYYGWEEDSAGNAFRWTRGESISILDPSGCSIGFSIRNPKSSQTLNSEIYLNGELVDTVGLRDSAWHPLEYYFSAGSERTISLKIKPDRTYRPATEGSKDARTIGVGITRFQWSCIPKDGIGFYPMEEDGGIRFAWTKKEASLLLEPKGESLLISVRSGPLVSQDHPVDLSIYWNGKLSKTVHLTQHDWQKVGVDLGKVPSRGILSLKVSETWNPLHSGFSNDDRELGIQVSKFQWAKPFIHANKPFRVTDEVMAGGTMLGYIKGRESYNRILYFPTFFPIDSSEQMISSVQFAKDGRTIPRRQGIFRPWDYQFPNEFLELQRETIALPSTTVYSRRFNAPSGRFVLRIMAHAQFAKNELPLALVMLNGKVIAHQPIASEELQDYFFEVQTQNGVNEISIQFLNDFYDAAKKLDRNIFIDEISVWPARPDAVTDGWDIVKESVVKIFKSGSSQPFLLSSTGSSFARDIDCSPGFGSLRITASGQLAGSELPRLGVYLNDTKLGVITVNSSEFFRYHLDPIPLTSGHQTLKLIFENDYYNPKTEEDRNVLISDVELVYPSGLLVTEPIGQELPIRESCYSVDYQATAN